ncbi:hypothetical protein ACS127_10315 [Amphibacillus sp. Q70]|uniref:hypothetical protein n=1 Tax=Amphibacillus sp. Q70 TaxID=3453416 RepID=UPI003F824F91
MNKIARALYVVGWLAIAGGLFLAIEAWGSTLVIDPTPWFGIIYHIGSGAVVGVVIFGFAEIINLLDKISKKE